MRGKTPQQTSMVALVTLESLVPERHPLRRVKPMVDALLKEMSPVFDEMYAGAGRPSVPPERLLKSMVLMALYMVRSERMFCEQLGYNMLFRWFLDMEMTERPFDATTFTHNRDRLLEHEVAHKFFAGVVEIARREGLVSNEHFSVDGTLIEAWASMKSFRPKDGSDDRDNNSFGGFKGTTRKNDTHASTTDPEAKSFRKGHGRESKLSFMGHAMIENRNGLVVDFDVSQATGRAEREVALEMVRRHPHGRRITVAADKAYDARSFIEGCRASRATPHVAMMITTHRGSAIDARTTRHRGYRSSMTARMLIEKSFGWMKTIGGLRRTRVRGLAKTRLSALFIAATYNLLRVSNLVTGQNCLQTAGLGGLLSAPTHKTGHMSG